MFQEGLFTELDKAIKQAHDLVGTRSLIYYLNRISKDFDFRKDNQYKLIESLVMHDMSLKTTDLLNPKVKKPEVVNGRKIIVLLTNQHTNIGRKTIYSLLSISSRTYGRYLDAMQNLIRNPQNDPELFKQYLKFNKLLNRTQ